MNKISVRRITDLSNDALIDRLANIAARAFLGRLYPSSPNTLLNVKEMHQNHSTLHSSVAICPSTRKCGVHSSALE
ncbi:hypothetical protein BD410DRAFT_782977 [Rickenella mellea]|uniref:Uncharacterized protein n=1 Tax=Rickenella mellea TaxID=50990 RepID=A0A4Y7QJ77_9AGAM|nr:hypothetical protein BD410DRAFT_782977 [Rickenella mellea]